VFNELPSNEDLRVFGVVVRQASFAEAATELGASPAYVSKRIRILEDRLGVKLLHRTTRAVQMTEEGERVYRWAQRILDDLDEMAQELGGMRVQARGSLRVCSSFGLGRLQVASALSALSEAQPALQFKLELFDRLVDVAAEGFDLDIRVGDDIAPHLIARRLADNHRVLCAAPAYLRQRGTPRTLDELRQHDCIVIKERDHPVGVWRLQQAGKERVLKVQGPLSTNNGEVALGWALQGKGILLRSVWQVGPMLARGELVQLLPEARQEANIWAVYPVRLEHSAKLRATVGFLQAWFGDERMQGLTGGRSGPAPSP
jgi:LysR family transcriptional activator of dmlA